ncbi:MAG: L-serine dehydratase [Bradyrhizobium sp.]|jgi:L-serine dehydratase|nr:L-serine dehydratase [Bradyrhizobium sp.]
MKAAATFMSALDERSGLERLKVTLPGSLAWTGKGHRTAKAVMPGLSGLTPESSDPDDSDRRADGIAATEQLVLADGTTIGFDPVWDIIVDFEEPGSEHPIAAAGLTQYGADMQAKYSETSRGGLAVNVPDC